MATAKVTHEMPLDAAIDIAIQLGNIDDKNVPIPYIVGPPGIGKTRLTEAKVAENGNNAFLALTPGLERQEKFGGIPDLNYIDVKYKKQNSNEVIEGKELHTVWSVPEMISKLRQLAANHKMVYCLLDDWHLAPAPIQAIGFELFTHKQLSGAKLPSNVRLILAGNETSAAGAKTQLSAIINRCMVLRCKPDVQYWIDNFAIPNNIHDAGISFLQRTDSQPLFNMAEQTTEQFATPRSWTAAFVALKHFESQYTMTSGGHALKGALLRSVMAGCVGDGAASKFWEYYTVYRDINAEKIFATGKFEVPEDLVKKYAFGSAISSEFYNLLGKWYAKYEKNKNDKKISEEMSKITNTFQNIVNELYKKSIEIAIMSVKSISLKKENAELGLPSGDRLMAEIMSMGKFDPKIVNEMCKRISKLKDMAENK